MIHLSDYIGKRLKDIVSPEGTNTIELEFDNGYRIIVKGVGEPGFVIKKEMPKPEEEKEKKARAKAKKEAATEKEEKTQKKKSD